MVAMVRATRGGQNNTQHTCLPTGPFQFSANSVCVCVSARLIVWVAPLMVKQHLASAAGPKEEEAAMCGVSRDGVVGGVLMVS